MPALIPPSKIVFQGNQFRTLALLLSGLKIKQRITHVLQCDWPIVRQKTSFILKSEISHPVIYLYIRMLETDLKLLPNYDPL